MLKIIKIISSILCFLVLLYIILFVTLIYPNDSRVVPPQISTLNEIKEHRFRISSLFIDKLNFSMDISEEIYAKKLEDLAKTYPNHLGRKSTRFSSPFQSFLSAGSYPYFLEGKDAVLLPSNSKITIKPQASGKIYVDFSLISLFSTAQVKVSLNGTLLKSMDLNQASEVEKSDSFVFKNFTRYAFPDREVKGGQWQKHSLALEISEQDTISFHCTSEKEGCFLSEPSFWRDAKDSEKNRNVIFILVDTFRHDALQSKHAPFLQSLKQRSISFENAMGAGNMTSISTNALLSCQIPSKIGSLAFSYGMSAKAQNEYYKESKDSFSKALQKNGIKTAMIGNISIISEILGIGINHGFDQQISIEMEGYDSNHITREGVRWLEENGKDPFFLYLHYNSPHAPYRAPLYDVLASLGGFKSLSSQREFLLSLYQAEIRYIDRNLELLHKALQKLGLDKNTILIVNSDHGDAHELRTYTENEAGPAYTGSMFDHVGTLLYNDVLHVPLLISFPMQSVAYERTEYVSSLDIGPTILDMYGFGLKKPVWFDGLSLFSEEIKTRKVLGSEGEDQRAIFFKNRYKYMKSYASSDKRMTPAEGYFTYKSSIYIGEQLFDLSKDPEEKVNLANFDKALLSEARDLFDNYFSIHETAQLIIDSPQGAKIEISIDPSEKDSLESVYNLKSVGSKLLIDVPDEKRVVIPFKRIPKMLPSVKVSGTPLRVELTSLKLPIDVPIQRLPGEELDLDIVPLSKSPSAFLVKTRSDQAKQRKLSFGNSRFENIFKEWGYLNEEN